MAVIEINWKPSTRDLRVFAVVQLLMVLVAAWLLHRRLEWDAAAIVLAAASVVLLVVGLVSPGLLKPFFVAWMCAAFPVGWVMSHLLLGVVYYGVLTPIGFALRCRGRDTLGLKRGGDEPSYWTVRPTPPDSPRYFRQF